MERRGDFPNSQDCSLEIGIGDPEPERESWGVCDGTDTA